MITNILKDNIWLYLLFLLIPILNVYSFGVGNIALIALLLVAIYGLISGNVFKKQKLFLLSSLLSMEKVYFLKVIILLFGLLHLGHFLLM